MKTKTDKSMMGMFNELAFIQTTSERFSHFIGCHLNGTLFELAAILNMGNEFSRKNLDSKVQQYLGYASDVSKLKGNPDDSTLNKMGIKHKISPKLRNKQTLMDFAFHYSGYEYFKSMLHAHDRNKFLLVEEQD